MVFIKAIVERLSLATSLVHMKTHLRTTLACLLLTSGCATTPQVGSGQLQIRITTLLGLQAANERDFRIQVDGRFVGNYDPEKTVLELPSGKHKIVVTLPSAYEIRNLPDGGATMRKFMVSGDERIDVLGGGSHQTLVFNESNLKMREIKDGTRD